MLWGDIQDFKSCKVGNENELGAFDKVKTSIIIFFQSEIAPLNWPWVYKAHSRRSKGRSSFKEKTGVKKANLVSRKRQNKSVYSTNPPSVYEPTDIVLVQMKKQGKKGAHNGRCRQAVVQRWLPSHNYSVQYEDGTKENVPVSDITDISRQKEKDWQKSSGNYFFSCNFCTIAALDNVNGNVCHHLSYQFSNYWIQL